MIKLRKITDKLPKPKGFQFFKIVIDTKRSFDGEGRFKLTQKYVSLRKTIVKVALLTLDNLNSTAKKSFPL